MPKRKPELNLAYPSRAERRRMLAGPLSAALAGLDEQTAQTAARLHVVPEQIAADWLLLPRTLGNQMDEFLAAWGQGDRFPACAALIELAAMALHMAEDVTVWQVGDEKACPKCGGFHAAAAPGEKQRQNGGGD